MNDNAAIAPPLAGARTSSTPTFWTWPRVALSLLAAVLIVVLGTLFGVYATWKNSGLIANGVVVQGQSLGGLSQDEAHARLTEHFDRLAVTIQTPARPYTLGLRQLGGQVRIGDAVQRAYWYGRNGSFVTNAIKYWTAQSAERHLTLPIKWDKPTLRRTMWTIATDYKREPRDASLRVDSAGIHVVPEESGRFMNVGATCADLQKKYFAGKPSVEAVTEEIAPRLAASDLAGRDVLLGEYPTHFDSGLRGRTQNIRLASEAINGKVLMPGEKFSFNSMTGERTPAKGYRIAHIFIRKPGAEKAEIVEGTGGGTCQVSSTLYNAIRRVNDRTGDKLAIIERNHHSLPVTYVPSGLDATVAWPGKDFRFRNKFPHPVYIRTQIKGSKLIVGIWGRVPENIESVSEPLDKRAAINTDSPA
jgi:vancomycin resistance protein YoaR